MSTPHIVPVVMAGGSGTRFWPLSRVQKPKQFLALATKRTLLEEAVARVSALSGPKDVHIVCGPAHARSSRTLLPRLPAGNFIVEPEARNTAPAIALATAVVAAKNPDATLLVVPSDQHVSRLAEFIDCAQVAARVAQEGYIVTLGIRPSRPETGYGYIQCGERLTDGAHRVARFVEKPNAATAEEYLVSGDYFWNGGIFIFRAEVMLDALAQHMPELRAGLAKIQGALGTKRYAAALKRHFKTLPATSIDYGVAERAANMAVVPGDFGWSDVGSFNALHDVRAQDAAGNIVEGKQTVVLDSEGCVVLSSRKLVSVVGMKDTVVVDTDDALLVMPRQRSQDVKKVVEALKQKKWSKYL